MSHLGTKICPNELIFHAHIEKKVLQPYFVLIKNQFDQVLREKGEF